MLTGDRNSTLTKFDFLVQIFASHQSCLLIRAKKLHLVTKKKYRLHKMLICLKFQVTGIQIDDGGGGRVHFD
jgi:hypothetical protein